MFTTGYYAVIENGRYVAAFKEYPMAARRLLASRFADPAARIVWVKSALVVGEAA